MWTFCRSRLRFIPLFFFWRTGSTTWARIKRFLRASVLLRHIWAGKQLCLLCKWWLINWGDLSCILDPCKVIGCNAPYNIGCQVLQNVPQCICPTCPDTRSPVCASDGVQDQSECHMKRQACIGNVSVAVEKRGPCGKCQHADLRSPRHAQAW